MTSKTSKKYRQGTERSIDPAETIERVLPLADRLGVTRVANVTGLDRIGIPVTMVVRPNSRSLTVSQGKGATLAAAKASGLMESLELYHGEHMKRPLLLGSQEDLIGDHRLVDIERLPRPATSPWHPALPLLWVEGIDLMNQESVWLPAELVDTNYTLPRLTGVECFHSNSNGLASGNVWVEALLHGICEVIERDAVTRWERRPEQQQRQSLLAPSSLQDPTCRQFLAQLEEAQLQATIWDITEDTRVPTFSCRLQDGSRSGRAASAADGAGCHPNPDVAVARAISEAAQSRLTFIAGSRDDLALSEYSSLEASPEEPDLPACPASRLPAAAAGWSSEYFEDDIDQLLQRLSEAGVQQVVAVALTREEFGIPVARVVIPGLEGMTPTRGEWAEIRHPSNRLKGKS